MKRRYDWDREYKGSHPRGNLSTPDYKVGKAQERILEYDNLLHLAIEKYEDRIEELSAYLDGKLDNCFRNGNNSNLIDRYLKICTDEDYAEIAKKAADYLDGLTIMERDKQKIELSRQIQHANGKQKNIGINDVSVKVR